MMCPWAARIGARRSLRPVSGVLIDPLQPPERFDRLRYVEVKHGRIAMLACLGHRVAGSGARFPGELSGGVQFSSITGTGLDAV